MLDDDQQATCLGVPEEFLNSRAEKATARFMMDGLCDGFPSQRVPANRSTIPRCVKSVLLLRSGLMAWRLLLFRVEFPETPSGDFAESTWRLPRNLAEPGAEVLRIGKPDIQGDLLDR